MKEGNVKRRWAALVIAVLALILVPFFLLGGTVEWWTNGFLESAASSRLAIAGVLSALLASDILLPVPSSIVSTACGFFLGFWAGMFASWLGMVVSCVFGFLLAAGVGQPLARRLLGEREMQRLRTMSRRYGDWVIVLARPVPVLAEASVLFAGMGQMRFDRFLLLSTLSNLGISAAYAAAGAFSAHKGSMLSALAGSICLPLVFMIVGRVLYRTRQLQTANDTTGT